MSSITAQEIINSHIFDHYSDIPINEKTETIVLEELKNAYNNEINKMHIDFETDKVFFSWLTQPLKIYMVLVPQKNSSHLQNVIVLAVKNNKDELQILDLKEKITEYAFINFDINKQISFLIKEKLLDLNPEEISSIISNGTITNVASIGENWAQSEYKHAGSHFKKPIIETLNFNELGLHAAKYEFDTVIKEIADQQFTAELNECLSAFEHEFYYVCAAGLGGVLESILYFSLDNYKLIDRSFPKDPTIFDFIRILKSNKIISRRDENYIKSNFLIRNSVSHYNSGFTNVSQCQTMMLGVRNLFSTIYLLSKEWKAKHPDLTYKEYLTQGN
ncbi:hypothetical protein BSQ39_08345 [Loigolactobacillus backii]|uniref:hypothetical protein n=1 Tax=Loigolactobacillus backii TaxID=375175 RepID=UPI000C1CB0C5|nr:hypothetical protein [Loigolactobacillus backii]PIO83571.1 hypothetical protein BSQ39_08345 [Loigolactobacillus backii]